MQDNSFDFSFADAVRAGLPGVSGGAQVREMIPILTEDVVPCRSPPFEERIRIIKTGLLSELETFPILARPYCLSAKLSAGSSHKRTLKIRKVQLMRDIRVHKDGVIRFRFLYTK